MLSPDSASVDAGRQVDGEQATLDAGYVTSSSRSMT
jgi:hypothetical protein